MSQQPPTGPSGTPGESEAPRTPGTPEEPGGEATESFARSPYDAPETQPTEEVPAYAASSYGQAPDPGRTIYSDASTTEPEPEPGPEEGRRRWVVPVVVAVVVLLIAGGIAAAMLLGDDGEEDPVAPATVEATTEATTTPEETTEPTATPTDAATEEPTTPEPTEEPTPSSELREDLEETISVEDLTFELSEDGFVPDDDVEGAVEAWRGVYVSGDYSIEMLATLWPDNDAADDFAAELVERTDGEEVDTGSTYTNDTGTYWAFYPVDGDAELGRYVWTTDRGHALEITGHSDYISPFYTSFPL